MPSITTADVVSVLDVKILTSSAHPNISVSQGENYDSVLDQLSLQTMTAGEEAAIGATASTPSASNPVVLVLDVPVYYPTQDLGEIRDSVATTADLPLVVTPLGDVTTGLEMIANISDMTSVVVGQQVFGVGIPNESYVVSVGSNFVTLNLAATATATQESITFTPTLGDIIPVLASNTLYRWNGSSWAAFLQTGTLDHTQLILGTLNEDPNYQHVPLATLLTLESQSHYHGFYFDPSDVNLIANNITNTSSVQLLSGTPVTFQSNGTLPSPLVAGGIYYVINSTPPTFQISQSIGGTPITLTSQGSDEGSALNSDLLSEVPMLDLITAAGSGQIITADERSHIPSAGQAAALVGTTANPPDAVNRYVTNQDPRLNTLRTPFVTIGVSTPPCSYPGMDVTAFLSALEGISYFPCAISVGSPAVITCNQNYNDGDIIYFQTSGFLPAGLTLATPYYVIDSSPNEFSVSLTPAGSPVVTTASGSTQSFLPSQVNTSTASINLPAHGLSNNYTVTFYSPGTLPTGLLPGQTYYVYVVDANNISVSLVPIVLTLTPSLVQFSSQGSGVLTLSTDAVSGNNPQVKALEVLPGDYQMYSVTTQNLQITLQSGGLLIQSLTPLSTVLNWQTFTDSIALLGPGMGPLTVRGIVFSLQGANTRGVSLQRDGCLIEDCSFIGQSPSSDNHVGVTIAANGVTLKRCYFSGDLTGVTIAGNNCLVDSCNFSLASPSYVGLSVASGSAETKVFGCYFNSCTLEVQAGALETDIRACNMGPTVTVVDAGINTKFTCLPSNDSTFYGQALYGQTKSLGPLGSLADYRGGSDAIFSIAMADAYAGEIEVLPGSFVFSNAVTIPDGKKIRGVSQKALGASQTVNITSIASTCFAMSSNTTLENVCVFAQNASAVTVSSATNVEILRCSLGCTTTSSSSQYAVEMSNCQNSTIDRCIFSGLTGVQTLSGTKLDIRGSVFSVSGKAFDSDTLCFYNQIKDNKILSGSVNISGQNLIVEGNHFLSGVPTKVNTTASVWQNNYPHPSANNFEGVDYLNIQLEDYLEPRTPGCAFGSILDIGALVFSKADQGNATSLPIKLQAKIVTSSTFSLTLNWTSQATSGDVLWQVTVTFRDSLSGTFGTPQVLQSLSSRTKLSEKMEDQIIFTFPAVYGLATAPTHASVDICRLPLDPTDTMPTDAFLTNSLLLFGRD